MNSAIATAGSGSSGNIGVGFAIPSNEAVDVAEQLIADGTADHPLLGVSVGEPTGASTDRRSPDRRHRRRSRGRGRTAGRRRRDPGRGAAVVDADSLIVADPRPRAGATVEVTYVRDGRQQTTSPTLASTD